MVVHTASQAFSIHLLIGFNHDCDGLEVVVVCHDWYHGLITTKGLPSRFDT